MVKLTVIIITFNEERNIARCLDSVNSIADEILVVDSNSIDKTIAIAHKYGAKVIQQSFMGYGEQKNFAADHATNNWILSLDADEALTPALQQSITEIKKNPQHSVYEMPRLTNYCGKWIRHCGWYPDRQTRLYDRTMGRWREQKVHEFWELQDKNGKKGLLKGDILHYSFSSINEHLRKIEKYSELAANAAVEKGKDASLFQIMISPKWHFVTEYVIKLGFLDGFSGYMICRLSAYAAFIKYSKIRMYIRAKKGFLENNTK